MTSPGSPFGDPPRTAPNSSPPSATNAWYPTSTFSRMIVSSSLQEGVASLPTARSCRQPLRFFRHPAGGRGHEFRTDRVLHGVAENGVDLAVRFAVQRPAEHIVERRQMLRRPRAPQRDLHSGLVEHPAHGESEHALAVTLPGEPIETGDRVEVLRVAGGAEL